AGRKLDFVLDHRGYKLESILATGPSSVFVSAQPGSLVSDYYATLRALVDRSRCTPRMVILTVSPRVFLNNGLSYPGESDYYRYFSTVTNLEEADALAYRSVFDRLGEDVRSRMRRPLLAVQPSQFVFLPNDLQIYQERQLMPPDLRVEQVSMNNQLGFLQKTINFLNAKKIYCLVVSMPVASGPTHQKYRRISIELCKKLAPLSSSKDFSFINLDNMRFQNDDFLDSIHLSQKGGETFAKAIAGYLNDSNLTRLIR
ncbi:MAG: hypothetical protein K2X93_28530, partial [Candidatus Obscuribacterales bacterium]|nr:hypothetical protein [Candidatus Obscuribacterales bacterium]